MSNLVLLHKVIHEIINSKEDLFYFRNQLNDKISFDCKNPDVLKILLPDFIAEIFRSYPIHKFNPYISLFFNKIAYKNMIVKLDTKTTFNYGEGISINVIDDYNEFIDSIRIGAESPEFKKSINDYQHKQRRNYKEFNNYVDNIFDIHPMLQVLKINLEYRSDDGAIGKIMTHKKCLEASQDRGRFLNNIRSNKMFKDIMPGYFWIQECAPNKGFNYHMFFFFNVSNGRLDETMAIKIGDYWNSTIMRYKDKDSNFKYINDIKNKKYVTHWFGMINSFDTGLIEGLKKEAKNLIKTNDFYARMIMPGNKNTFGKKLIRLNNDK